MAITRAKKEALVAQYKELIENSPALVFTNYRGVSVSQIQSLRAKLSETDATYIVVKNTLLDLALKESGYEITKEALEGPNAVIFTGEDIGRSVTALSGNSWVSIRFDSRVSWYIGNGSKKFATRRRRRSGGCLPGRLPCAARRNFCNTSE